MTDKERAENLFETINAFTFNEDQSIRNEIIPLIVKVFSAIREDQINKDASLAFGVELKYSPSVIDSECCKCSKSHAKADGAAEVVNSIQSQIREVLPTKRRKAK